MGMNGEGATPSSWSVRTEIRKGSMHWPWGDYGSKKRYIEEFNKLQMHFYNESKKFGSNRKPPDLLREEDYDI